MPVEGAVYCIVFGHLTLEFQIPLVFPEPRRIVANWSDRFCEPAQKPEGGIREMSSEHTQSNRSAKRVRPAVALLLLLLAFSLLPGCGTTNTYDGPSLPKAEIAVLKTPIFATFSIIPKSPPQINNIDGKAVGSSLSRLYELLPGRHHVSFWMEHVCYFFFPIPCGRSNGSIEFDAKAGHYYELDAKVDGDLVWSWVIDKSSNEVVAGEKPP